MSTGTTIRDLRKEHRLSQTELAKAVHVSQATVTAWETGKAEPSSSALNTLASYFNVSADYLLGRKESENKTADLADKDTVFTYEGREIPPEDLEYMKRLLRGGKQ
ncbi:Helix-turn-helix motif [Limosilactobacillus reuteri]|uniref:Helix-turn-helix motif n=1 Tax=Limosilactobacillus reuteri TaxID=1598 RepID=A0A0U5FCF5_LIMRT|nr:Helix-turn-helix motif [Limosilactobacillus reuteri]